MPRASTAGAGGASSGYGLQLREKQKMKRFYGMSEKQFRLFFERAERQKGITGETLLQMLERRLDNVLFISGFAHSRAHARQLVNHGHVTVNERPGHVPSFMVKTGDVVSFRARSAKSEDIKAVAEAHATRPCPAGSRSTGTSSRPGSPACRRAPTSRSPSKSTCRRALLQVRELDA